MPSNPHAVAIAAPICISLALSKLKSIASPVRCFEFVAPPTAALWIAVERQRSTLNGTASALQKLKSLLFRFI